MKTRTIRDLVTQAFKEDPITRGKNTSNRSYLVAYVWTLNMHKPGTPEFQKTLLKIYNFMRNNHSFKGIDRVRDDMAAKRLDIEATAESTEILDNRLNGQNPLFHVKQASKIPGDALESNDEPASRVVAQKHIDEARKALGNNYEFYGDI